MRCPGLSKTFSDIDLYILTIEKNYLQRITIFVIYYVTAIKGKDPILFAKKRLCYCKFIIVGRDGKDAIMINYNVVGLYFKVRYGTNEKSYCYYYCSAFIHIYICV